MEWHYNFIAEKGYRWKDKENEIFVRGERKWISPHVSLVIPSLRPCGDLFSSDSSQSFGELGARTLWDSVTLKSLWVILNYTLHVSSCFLISDRSWMLLERCWPSILHSASFAESWWRRVWLDKGVCCSWEKTADNIVCNSLLLNLAPKLEGFKNCSCKVLLMTCWKNFWNSKDEHINEKYNFVYSRWKLHKERHLQ